MNINIKSSNCVKQSVTAVIKSVKGELYIGQNNCNNPQEICPRVGMKTGEGYNLCKTIKTLPGLMRNAKDYMNNFSVENNLIL